MINSANTPAIYRRAGAKPMKAVALDALKGLHTSFNGYGVADGEIIEFPTIEQMADSAQNVIRVGEARPGSANKSALVLVKRYADSEDTTGRESWYNLSNLTQQYYAEKDVHARYYVDELRAMFGTLADDAERASIFAGKKIVGTGKVSGYRRDFDEKAGRYLDTFGDEPVDYVTIDWYEG